MNLNYKHVLTKHNKVFLSSLREFDPEASETLLRFSAEMVIDLETNKVIKAREGIPPEENATQKLVERLLVDAASVFRFAREDRSDGEGAYFVEVDIECEATESWGITRRDDYGVPGSILCQRNFGKDRAYFWVDEQDLSSWNHEQDCPYFAVNHDDRCDAVDLALRICNDIVSPKTVKDIGVVLKEASPA